MTLLQSRASFKAVLLGDSGVGKTSLITRWTTNSYTPALNPTIGTHHQRKRVQINDREVDLFIWDTAGQEQFHALTPLYARSSAVAILTVSIVESSSLSSVDRWIGLLSSANDTLPPVILAVNKVDLRDEAVKSTDEIQEEFGGRFAGVFFVSAATGEEVNNLFMFAALAGLRFIENGSASETKAVMPELAAAQKKSECC
jgi:small GTP-binding protein